ncbi:MAG: 3-phosphoshikimate 1-carboxyvinyltransferase [Bacteroidota bacterium]
MCIKVYPSSPSGKIQVPPSKSYMQRALVAGLLSDGYTKISNPGYSNDDINVLHSIENLGAEISYSGNGLLVKGGLNLKQNEIHAGESGLGIRLIAPVAGLFDREITITGEGSLLNRPMHALEKSLNNLGALCSTNTGYLPISVKGPIKGGEIELDGSLSSQFLSGLLFALPIVANESILNVRNLKSKPYIDLTLDILKSHGITIENKNYKTFYIKGNQHYKSCDHFMEGDWSNGAFLLVAGAINGQVEVNGLNPDSLQGDKGILEALQKAGAKVSFQKPSYKAEKTTHLKAFEFDANEMPDLFPPLACLAAYCNGTSTIKGVKRLIHKESNRAASLFNEFSKMGIDIKKINEDTLQIKGGTVDGGLFDSHNDHRIAMAGAVLALNSKNPIKITRHKAVNKSYPSFFNDLKKLNIEIKEES